MKLAADEVTWAEKLAEQGYGTAGFTANLQLTDQQGYAQGFEHWFYDRAINPLSTIKTRGERLRHSSIEWLDGSFAQRRPTPALLYFQYMEPHAPYQPPEPYRSRFGRPDAGQDEMAGANWKLVRLELSDLSDREGELLESYYDAEVAAVDAEIALLFAELERRNFLDNAIVLVTADHGEEFRDHGSFSHGSSLYNEVVRVPLLLLAPSLVPGQVVQQNVSLIDVSPTILDLLGLPPEPRFEGRSLLPLLRKRKSLLDYLQGGPEGKGPVGEALVLLELAKPGWVDHRRHTAGLIEGRTKFLVNEANRSTELFDLAVDARELSPQSSTEGSALAVALRKFQSSLRNPRAIAEQVELDEALKERLRALGYAF
jgi:arylsulfatase A-like enzyme